MTPEMTTMLVAAASVVVTLGALIVSLFLWAALRHQVD